MGREKLEGYLDVPLLAAVAAGEAHGYAIVRRLREQNEGPLDLGEGTLYPSLHRLESSDPVDSAWATVGGRRAPRARDNRDRARGAFPRARGVGRLFPRHRRDPRDRMTGVAGAHFARPAGHGGDGWPVSWRSP